MTAISSVYRKPQAAGRARTELELRDIINIGIMQRKRLLRHGGVYEGGTLWRFLYGIGLEEHDQEGRKSFTRNMKNTTQSRSIPPNSQSELGRLTYRMEWEDAF